MQETKNSFDIFNSFDNVNLKDSIPKYLITNCYNGVSHCDLGKIVFTYKYIKINIPHIQYFKLEDESYKIRKLPNFRNKKCHAIKYKYNNNNEYWNTKKLFIELYMIDKEILKMFIYILLNNKRITKKEFSKFLKKLGMHIINKSILINIKSDCFNNYYKIIGSNFLNSKLKIFNETYSRLMINDNIINNIK